MTRLTPRHGLLALPVVLYLAVAIVWQFNGSYAIAGDEPHYLLTTDSLVRDHDLLVANNYFQDTPVQRASRVQLSDPLNFDAHVHNGFSIHGIGLPVLLIIPYAAWGVFGAKLFMALLAGLFPFVLYRALRLVIDSQGWSILIALSLGVGLPYLAAANQIFPDLPGGLIILVVAERIVGVLVGRYPRRPSTLATASISLIIAYLPWLHIRLLAPALLLLMGYVYVVYTGGRNSPISYWRLIIPIVSLALSLALLGSYNFMAFKSVLGIYDRDSLNLEVQKFGMTFLGLHWDVAQGMFLQQPLLLIGLFGIPAFAKANWRAALLVGLVYISVLLPNAMHPNWYGGYSIWGRFGWASVSLWVFPLAYALKSLLRRVRIVVLVQCVASWVLQVLFANQWLLSDYYLFNMGVGIPVWSASGLYAGLLPAHVWQWQPYFMEFDRYLTHWPNAVAVLSGFMLVLTGWLGLHGRARITAAVWMAFVTVALIGGISFPPLLGTWMSTADNLPGNVGSVDGISRVARDGETGSGHLTFGPYLRLPAGTYVLTLDYNYSHTPSTPVAQWDIAYDNGHIAGPSGDLPVSVGEKPFTYRLSVAPAVTQKYFEFRVFYPGSGNLRVSKLAITPIDLE